MSDSSKTVISTIITLLKADLIIASIFGTKIYTSIPQGIEYPFMKISIKSAPNNTLKNPALEHSVRIQAFTEFSKTKQALDTKEAIYALFERSSNFTYCVIKNTDMFTEPNNVCLQSVLDFNIYL